MSWSWSHQASNGDNMIKNNDSFGKAPLGQLHAGHNQITSATYQDPSFSDLELQHQGQTGTHIFNIPGKGEKCLSQELDENSSGRVQSN